MTQHQQDLQPLVTDLADYIAATAEPNKTTSEAVSTLIQEINARLDAARGFLKGKV